jgi:hypothetical protein
MNDTTLYVFFFKDILSAKNSMRKYQSKLLSAGISYTTNSASMTVFTEYDGDVFKAMFCPAQTHKDLERLGGLSISGYVYSDGFKPTPEMEAYIHSRVRQPPSKENN